MLFFYFFPGANRHAEFSNLDPDIYTLRVEAKNQVRDRELIRRSFEITDDPKRCTVHLINSGVSVESNVVTVQFASSEPVKKLSCNLDREDYYDCMLIYTSPVFVEFCCPYAPMSSILQINIIIYYFYTIIL